MRNFGEEKGILTEAWGPLGQGKYELAELPGLSDIALKHDKTIQQVTLRWHLQEGGHRVPEEFAERAACGKILTSSRNKPNHLRFLTTE